MDGILCLIEGAKVVGVSFTPDSEVEDGKGYKIPNSTASIWKGEANYFRQSFWDLIVDIHNKKNDFLRNKNPEDYFIYFGFHETSGPMSWKDCELSRDFIALGVPKYISAWDTYSDLTGYLWTNYDVQCEGKGHNVWERLNQIEYGKYITLKFEIKRKESS